MDEQDVQSRVDGANEDIERRERRSDRKDRHREDDGKREESSRSRSSRSSKSSRSSSSRKRSHSRERDSRHKRKSKDRSPRDKRDRSPRSRKHSHSKRSRSPSSRSPSPPRRRRKSDNWDKAPAGFEGMNVAQVAQVNPAVLMPLLSSANPQQTRQARRLYVGNIPDGVGDQELMEFFNTAMTSSGVPLKATPPVMAAQLNVEKSFAFLEFAALEDATEGMALDGITLQGQSLKVRRPKDYVAPQAQEIIAKPSVHIPGIVSTNVPDSPNKIFIGGLPSYLNEEQVKELVSSFGPLKSFNLVKDSDTGNSKGYAFFEYLDAGVTDRACSGLNGMKLGDKTLLVQRAHLGVANQDPSTLLSLPIGTVQALTNPTAANFLNLAIPAATLLGGLLGQLKDSSSSPETRVLQLLNLLTAEQLVDEYEYQDIYEDIQQECERFGKIYSITIPRPRIVDGKLDPTIPVHGVGRIFVEYSCKEEAIKGQQMLGGRKFNNRTILTSFYDEDLYDMRDFSRH